MSDLSGVARLSFPGFCGSEGMDKGWQDAYFSTDEASGAGPLKLPL